jgi:hypothetical protein
MSLPSKPKIRWRVLFTLVVAGAWALCSFLYGSLQGPVMGHLAVKQGSSVMGYSVNRALELGFVPQLFAIGAYVLLRICWGSYSRSKHKYDVAVEAVINNAKAK